MDEQVRLARPYRKRTVRCGAWACVTAALAIFPQFSARAMAQTLEYQVKAAFLLNFTKFVGWPAESFVSADSPLSICILGDDPFGSSLDQIVAGEVANGRKVTIQRTREPQPKSCQVLFVGARGGGREKEKELSVVPDTGPGVLTVGEGDDFLRSGGMIAFVIENRRVRFDVNLAAAANAGLKISSKLLSVAKSVEK